MPEYPDVIVYLEALERTIGDEPLQGIRLKSPFLLRSVDPPLQVFRGRRVEGYERLGKRLVLDFGDEFFLVLHLMIAGRLRWRKAGAGLPGKVGLAAFDFAHGSLVLTEAGTQKRASLYAVRGREGLAEHDRGGLDVLEIELDAFRERLVSANHTLKRALCDPRLFSGIGNAYSDEILHRARLSPLQWTSRLDPQEIERLYVSIREVLLEWAERLRAELGDEFPDKVTAFRPEMAVHGKFKEPCPVCSSPVQRIVYAKNETNYCARCQTNGKVLADRALSRLLKDDWPRALDD